ncbi:MAG TPA: damage-inducible protein DinB [Actinobacteria bacterium]|nr:damage-inducible protein DinB [Actinomycetota bacterium]HCP60896.1 damage-inducible protein DinB [Actinomycetota bacterium]
MRGSANSLENSSFGRTASCRSRAEKTEARAAVPPSKMPGMDVLVEFFRHNTMMNRRLMEACRQLPPEQLGATATGTYGSIGATLVHIANSQESYAARLLDTERPERLPEDPFPGFDALAERFAHGDAQLEEAATQAGQDRKVRVTGDDPPGTWLMPVSLFLLQAVNHATEHRSQVATILTELGVEPPEMDGWTYFFASGHMVAV